MTSKHKIKIMIVDDHPVVRDGLKDLLSRENDMSVCAEASSHEEAVIALADNQIDLAIVDISLKNSQSGLDLVKAIKSRYSHIQCLVLSMHDENIYAERSLKAGALGYVMKHEAGKKVVESIRLVSKGEIAVSPAVSKRIMQAYLHGAGTDADPVHTLSDRELEVFRMVGMGKKTSEIAQSLCLSVSTVETYRAHIKEKLGISNSAELSRIAFEHSSSLRV